jgi:hypothetical protein
MIGLGIFVWIMYGLYGEGYFDRFLDMGDYHSFTSVEDTTCRDLQESATGVILTGQDSTFTITSVRDSQQISRTDSELVCIGEVMYDGMGDQLRMELSDVDDKIWVSYEIVSNMETLIEQILRMDENTELLVDMTYEVCTTDISPKSVKLMNNIFYECANFSAEVADMEKLPFADESFNGVCSAGSLSYGDNTVVMNEIYRVLKRGGSDDCRRFS